MNFSNNIVLNGQHTQLLYSCFSGPKRPGNRFLRNIISFAQRSDDGLTPLGDRPAGSMASWAERVLDISCLNASRTPYDPTRFAEVDYNLYYDPALALATALWIFPRFANGSWATNGSLASWRSFGGMDRHSVVADPLFVDALVGNFSLQPSSPAWALGWQPLPAPP